MKKARRRVIRILLVKNTCAVRGFIAPTFSAESGGSDIAKKPVQDSRPAAILDKDEPFVEKSLDYRN